MTITGLILCGGASRRMGRPKALLEFQGETFLDRVIGALRAGCDEVVVVLGHQADAIRKGVRRGAEARFVINPRYEEGQLSSLQRGLQEAGGASAVMFTPVDYPAVAPETVAALSRAVRESLREFLIFAPRCDGRSGHPVAFVARLAAEFLALPAGATARDVIHRYKAQTFYLDVKDRGVLHDVDNPEDYVRLVEGGCG